MTVKIDCVLNNADDCNTGEEKIHLISINSEYKENSAGQEWTCAFGKHRGSACDCCLCFSSMILMLNWLCLAQSKHSNSRWSKISKGALYRLLRAERDPWTHLWSRHHYARDPAVFYQVTASCSALIITHFHWFIRLFGDLGVSFGIKVNKYSAWMEITLSNRGLVSGLCRFCIVYLSFVPLNCCYELCYMISFYDISVCTSLNLIQFKLPAQ